MHAVGDTMPPRRHPTIPACTFPLREALNDSISSGRFVDTKVILYSRRDASGSIIKPKALYANSHVLKSVPYFSHCESTSTLSRARRLKDPFEVLSGIYSESEQRDFSEPISEDEQAENYGYYSDSDLEDDEDAVNATGNAVKKTVTLNGTPFDPSRLATNGKTPAPVYGERTELSGKGTIIKIHDIAFIT